MVQIKAIKKWNQTPYLLTKDKRYKFSATGQWIDWYITTDAKGFEKIWLKPFEPLRRFPNAKWFSLIGAIDRDRSTQFDIGLLVDNQKTYIATKNGILYCFANDVSLAYSNNKGSIDLKVEEVEEK